MAIRLVVCKDYDEMSRRGADEIAKIVQSKPECVLGLATGSTPCRLYEYLAEDYKAGKLDFSKARSVNLDEYKGLGPDDDQSYRFFMNRELFSKININIENTFVVNGLEPDEKIACGELEAQLDEYGPADIQILGIGENGHIGFNEPAEQFTLRAHEVALTESTIAANARFFEDESKVPTKAYSMGIGNIMSAGKIVLLASGEKKAEAIEKTMNGIVDPKVPSSILQLHPDVVIIVDLAAASKISTLK